MPVFYAVWKAVCPLYTLKSDKISGRQQKNFRTDRQPEYEAQNRADKKDWVTTEWDWDRSKKTKIQKQEWLPNFCKVTIMKVSFGFLKQNRGEVVGKLSPVLSSVRVRYVQKVYRPIVPVFS